MKLKLTVKKLLLKFNFQFFGLLSKYTLRTDNKMYYLEKNTSFF